MADYMYLLLDVLRLNATTLLVFVLVLLLAYFSVRKPAGIPPGSAFTVPILGDLPLLIATGGDIVQTFRSLRNKKGDIFSFYIGKDLMIVINGFELIHKAAVRNGWTFSGRPQNFINNIATNGRGVIMASGPFWKRQRKFTLSCLQELGFRRSAFEDKIQTEVRYFVDILRAQQGKPFDIRQPLHAAVENVLFATLCGKRHNYDDDFYQAHLRNSELVGKKLMNASALLSCLPCLQYLPGDPLGIDLIRKLFKVMDDYLIEIYNEHIRTHADYENDPRDFMDMFISQMNKNGPNGENTDFTLNQMTYLIMDLLGAGTETTAATISFAILYLLKYPKIKQRLQVDIDKIIESDRPPILDDREKLPYVEAFISEVQRLANVVPLAIPHSVMAEEDVIFEGYRIPKNATVTFNIGSIFTDPKTFVNPMKFDPERFLDSGGHLVRQKEVIPFGIGRRVCLGEAVARMDIFLFLTTLLKQFDFKPEDGVELARIDSEFGTLIHRPRPFKVRAVER